LHISLRRLLPIRLGPLLLDYRLRNPHREIASYECGACGCDAVVV